MFLNKTFTKALAKILVLSLFLFSSFYSVAQRKYQDMDRGVVAISNAVSSSTPVFISWRMLLQDPEDVKFNIYCKKGGAGEYELLNTGGPQSKTNFSTTYDKVPANSLISVAPVVNGIEGSKSLPFKYLSSSYRSLFLDLSYDGFLTNSSYTSKFVWPADLDGDGEFDYVVDRLSLSGGTHKVEGYLRTGQRLWTIDMGPNVNISAGHDDMVVAYDMNCDGKSEIVIKSSDGTRFWDSTNKTWGKYLMDATNGDTDKDGIIDYSTQSTKVPPQYITVVNGMTGAEMNTIEMPYPNDSYNTYTRFSKANYMDDEYSKLNGHMGIVYLDGVHPSVVMEYKCRWKDDNSDRSKFHFYYVTAWGYNFVNGVATDWVQKYTWNRNYQNAAEFHHIRVADVDLDGKDEMLEGGYTIDDNGSLLFSALISHGDRFRTGDINPSRPGLETFAIQQNAPDMLGQILYDASNGKAIKKFYLAGVGDVGRGECIDIDKNYKGYEMWSTMGNIYNCEGDIIYKGSVDQPKEGIWWDGELDREILSAPDGNGYNPMVVKYAGNGSYHYNRLLSIYSITNYGAKTEYGVRPAFFGDMIGDWREELILKKSDDSGLYGFTTDYPTDVRMYCLMQNASYRMQTTTKGYYQSPYPDFYLGYDMQRPPLSPFIKVDLVWKSGAKWDLTSTSFTDYTEATNLAFANGKSVMFDISGNNNSSIILEGNLSPDKLYVMTPIGHDYTFTGNGKITGNTDLWKSLNGRFILNGNHDFTGKTYITEGTLELNGSLKSTVDLRAKGTLAGNAVLNGGLISEPGLNYEGGRLSPGTVSKKFGKITFNSDLNLEGGIYLEMNIQTKGAGATDTVIVLDTIQVNGNVNFSKLNYIRVIPSEEKPFAGKYPIMKWTGSLTGDISNFSIMGLKGLSTDLLIESNTLYLIINGMRAPKTGVTWTGSESAIWDFNAENFSIAGEPVSFVNGDQVIFNDEPAVKSITLNEYLQISGMTVDNSSTNYTFSGTNGGISGSGGITKEGSGALRLLSTKNDYTGPTIVNGGVLEVASLADGGMESSIGKASAAATNLVLNGTTLKISNANTASNRAITIKDTSTIDIPQSGSYATMKGIITGSGMLVKTGSGQLNVTYDGSTNYSGGTLVKAGSIAMGTWRSTFGNPGSKLELQGSSSVNIFSNDNTSQVPVFNYALVVPGGSNATLNAGRRCKINGTLTGSGTLTLTIPYVRADLIGNWSGFQGTLNVSGNQFRLCNSNGFQNASLNLKETVYMEHFVEGSGSALSGGSSKIGSLDGDAGTSIGNGTYSVGHNNKDANFRGVISAGVNISKYGTGMWTLSNANSFTSNFNIYGGTVYLSNTTGSATGSAPVYVKQDATLDGTGLTSSIIYVENGGTLTGSLTIGGPTTLKTGSTLNPGSTSVKYAKKITVNNNLTLQAGCHVNMKIFGGVYASCDQLVVKNTFAPGGILNITAPTSYLISEGSVFQLFNAETISTTRFDSIYLPQNTNVSEWDTTKLYSEGKLIAAKATALDKPGSGKDFDVYPTIIYGETVLSAGSIMGKAYVSITNNAGIVVFETELNADEKRTVNLEALDPGVYVITFKTPESSTNRKIIKK
jgi:autotransporter-associated beta strand protein